VYLWIRISAFQFIRRPWFRCMRGKGRLKCLHTSLLWLMVPTGTCSTVSLKSLVAQIGVIMGNRFQNQPITKNLKISYPECNISAQLSHPYFTRFSLLHIHDDELRSFPSNTMRVRLPLVWLPKSLSIWSLPVCLPDKFAYLPYLHQHLRPHSAVQFGPSFQAQAKPRLWPRS